MAKSSDLIVSAERFRALMERHGLYGRIGNDKAAALLYCTRNTIETFYSRGLPLTKFELLEYKLSDGRIHRE